MNLEKAIEAATEAIINAVWFEEAQVARIAVEAAAPHLDPHRATCDRYWETLEQRAECAEAEVERNRKTAMHWFELYEANRLLADRLAETLRLHMKWDSDFHNGEPCDCDSCAAIAAWKEARHESQEQLAIESETQG